MPWEAAALGPGEHLDRQRWIRRVDVSPIPRLAGRPRRAERQRRLQQPVVEARRDHGPSFSFPDASPQGVTPHGACFKPVREAICQPMAKALLTERSGPGSG
jgi:hypothetical protein